MSRPRDNKRNWLAVVASFIVCSLISFGLPMDVDAGTPDDEPTELPTPKTAASQNGEETTARKPKIKKKIKEKLDGQKRAKQDYEKILKQVYDVGE